MHAPIVVLAWCSRPRPHTHAMQTGNKGNAGSGGSHVRTTQQARFPSSALQAMLTNKKVSRVPYWAARRHDQCPSSADRRRRVIAPPCLPIAIADGCLRVDRRATADPRPLPPHWPHRPATPTKHRARTHRRRTRELRRVGTQVLGRQQARRHHEPRRRRDRADPLAVRQGRRLRAIPAARRAWQCPDLLLQSLMVLGGLLFFSFFKSFSLYFRSPAHFPRDH